MELLLLAFGIVAFLSANCGLIYFSLLPLFYFLLVYFSILRLKHRIFGIHADIEVLYQQRRDAVSSSLKMLKKYLDHEHEVFSKLASLKSSSGSEFLAIIATVKDSYPELDSEGLLIETLNLLKKIELRLAASRRNLLAYRSRYLSRTSLFPNNLVVTICRALPLIPDIALSSQTLSQIQDSISARNEQE
ncbi:MAG: LemA family protein [Bdellovibrionales bacterium]|nr:LemA family protein [Bdellovibrionales bacterium]